MKRPALRVMAILIGIPALVVAALTVYAWASSASTFATHGKEIEEDVAALRKGRRHQPVLYGDGNPGNGWDYFARGMAGLQKAPKFDDEGRVAEHQDADQADLRDATPALDRIFDGFVPDQQNLREAFSRTEFDPHPDFENANGPTPVWDFSLARAAAALAARARRLHELGRDAEALDVLILGLATTHGYARQEPLISDREMMYGEGILLSALRKVLEAHALTARDLRDASQRLEKLLPDRPTITAALRVDMVRTRRSYLLLGTGPINGHPELELDGESRLLGWKYLFSRRLMVASALESWTGFAQRYLKLDALPVHQRAAAAREIVDDVISVRNPMLWKFNPTYNEHYTDDARSLSNLALAGLALALARFEVENGRPAAALSDLTPALLRSIPADPNTGTPFIYRDCQLRPATDPAEEGSRGGVRPAWTVRRGK